MSKKHIRPLAAYRKAEPRMFKLCWGMDERATSKKGKENSFYWYYACFEANDINREKTWEKTKFIFFNDRGARTNISTITELGRLQLEGWYYGVTDFTDNVARYIYNTYLKKQATGQELNDQEYCKAIKHIRENIGYYHTRPDEVKLFIIEGFFKDELKPMLPDPPEELKIFEEAVEWVTERLKTQRRRGADYWINQAGKWEDYAYYLEEILEEYGIKHNDFKTWEEERTAERKKYFDEITALKNERREQMLNGVKQIEL